MNYPDFRVVIKLKGDVGAHKQVPFCKVIHLETRAGALSFWLALEQSLVIWLWKVSSLSIKSPRCYFEELEVMIESCVFRDPLWYDGLVKK